MEFSLIDVRQWPDFVYQMPMGMDEAGAMAQAMNIPTIPHMELNHMASMMRTRIQLVKELAITHQVCPAPVISE